MIDEKKLIEEIRKRRDYWESKAAEYDEAGERYEYLMDVCDGKATELTTILSIVNEQPKVAEWIPCSERLPEGENEVLVTVSGKLNNITFDNAIEIGFYCAIDGWIINWYLDWTTPEVTAWMPLPEPWGGEDK